MDERRSGGGCDGAALCQLSAAAALQTFSLYFQHLCTWLPSLCTHSSLQCKQGKRWSCSGLACRHQPLPRCCVTAKERPCSTGIHPHHHCDGTATAGGTARRRRRRHAKREGCARPGLESHLRCEACSLQCTSRERRAASRQRRSRHVIAASRALGISGLNRSDPASHRIPTRSQSLIGKQGTPPTPTRPPPRRPTHTMLASTSVLHRTLPSLGEPGGAAGELEQQCRAGRGRRLPGRSSAAAWAPAPGLGVGGAAAAARQLSSRHSWAARQSADCTATLPPMPRLLQAAPPASPRAARPWPPAPCWRRWPAAPSWCAVPRPTRCGARPCACPLECQAARPHVLPSAASQLHSSFPPASTAAAPLHSHPHPPPPCPWPWSNHYR